MQTTGLKGTPLSYQQRRLWSLQQDATGWIGCRVSIEGDVNSSILNKALQQLIDRHEILRTAFLRISGMFVPVQVVKEHMHVHCPVISLENLSLSEQQEQLTTYQYLDSIDVFL